MDPSLIVQVGTAIVSSLGIGSTVLVSLRWLRRTTYIRIDWGDWRLIMRRVPSRDLGEPGAARR